MGPLSAFIGATPGQGGDGPARQLAQFGQVREQAVRADRADACDLGQPLDPRL